MASEGGGKRKGVAHREGLRKVAKSRPPLLCPICDISLQPETIETHFQLELERLKQRNRRNRKRRHSSSVASPPMLVDVESEGEVTLIQQTRMALDGVKRRRFVFQHGSQDPLHDQPGPSHSPPASSTCPVCYTQLPASEQQAAAHISSCIASNQSDSSDSEVYEEYTWGDITRVRATSMLDARTRANLFNGTVILYEAEEENCVLDVEGDSSEVYGPSQFDERDLISLKEGKSPSKQEAESESSDPLVKKEVESGSSCKQGSSGRQGVESGGSCDQDSSARQGVESGGSCDQGSSARQGVESGGSCDQGSSARQGVESGGSCDQGFSANQEAKSSPHCLVCMGAQKLCPKCKTITCASDLRRIFL